MFKCRPMPSSVDCGFIPHWDVRSLHRRLCPICETDSSEELCIRPDGLVVVQCCSCTMVFVRDIPDETQLGRLYDTYGTFKGLSSGHVAPRKVRQMARRNEFIAVLERTGGVNGTRVIELGCSNGVFLQMARSRGAEVSGVDLDRDALRHLKEIGITGKLSLDEHDQADVVCAFQLLEHVPNPRGLVRDVSRALREDGRFLVAVPNGGEVNEIGPPWIGFRVDLEHLNYFSARTLARLFAQNGLFIENVWRYAQPVIPRRELLSSSANQPSGGLWALARQWLARRDGYRLLGSGAYVLVAMARKKSIT